jgi:Xaa-Pro aminopeptidase
MKRFKKILQDYRINGYIVPKNDEYFNEYVNSSQDRLKFISNFSGSAGFALILENQNYLFTDGRYTIQANNESGKKFKVITIPKKFPKDVIKTKKKIIVGFDPKLHTEKQLKLFFEVKNVDLVPINQNLVDKVWINKPKEVVRPFFKIALKHAGKSTETKIQKVKKALKENKADYLLVTAPENVAWLLNIRGGDSSFSPIPNARLLISKKIYLMIKILKFLMKQILREF